MGKNLSEKILKLKKEKNAIILAHLYQTPEIQEIADYVGDSYYLSKIARDCKEDLIIFCGVKFMGKVLKSYLHKKQLFCQLLMQVALWLIWHVLKI